MLWKCISKLRWFQLGFLLSKWPLYLHRIILRVIWAGRKDRKAGQEIFTFSCCCLHVFHIRLVMEKQSPLTISPMRCEKKFSWGRRDKPPPHLLSYSCQRGKKLSEEGKNLLTYPHCTTWILITLSEKDSPFFPYFTFPPTKYSIIKWRLWDNL